MVKVTQAEADQIVIDIKDELRAEFGDIVNIDLEKAKKIAKYCREIVKLYTIENTPVHYAYWTHLANKYEKAVYWTIKSSQMNGMNCS